MILLYHETATHGSIATPERVGREHHPSRSYRHDGHFVALDGEAHVIAYDAEEICKILGYRLATAQEQDAYHAQKRKAETIHEGRSSRTQKGGE